MRNYAENARLCGNMRKITKCAENNKLLKAVNCAIPHPSHLIGASGCFNVNNLCYCAAEIIPCSDLHLYHAPLYTMPHDPEYLLEYCNL